MTSSGSSSSQKPYVKPFFAPPKHQGSDRPLSDLRVNNLYILLQLRASREHDDFNWALYMHKSGDTGGNLFQILRSGAGFQPTNVFTATALNSTSTIGLIRVAAINTDNVDTAVALVEQDNPILDTIPNMDEKVYVLRALERIRAGGLMAANTWNSLDLEQEILVFGNNHIMGAWNGLRPRALDHSRVCGLTSV